MGTKNLAEDPYEKLANAIVLQSVSDYRAALRLAKKNPSAEQDVKNLERFFRSEWYSVLTGVDPEYLMERLREEANM